MMRSLLLPILLVLTAIRSVEAAPKIACPAPVFEFGAVDRDEPVKHTFVISNQGDSALTIGRVRACCGATAKLGSKTIAPGTNTTLDVTLSLKHRVGAQKKSFYVASNDRKTPYYQLQLVGTAVASVYMTPSYVNFGAIELNTSKTQEVILIHTAQTPLKVTNLVSSVRQFSVEQLASESNRYTFVIATVPPLALGITRGEVKVYTDNPKHKEFVIGVSATVASDLVVAPQEILLKEQAGGIKPVTRYVAVRSRAKRPFKILKVAVPDEGSIVKTEPLGDSGYRCELKNIMPFPDLDGKSVIVTTDIEGTPELAIPIRVVSD